MKLADVLQPAIDYAERGFPVTDVIAGDWDNAIQHKANADFAATFLPNGKPLAAGEIFTNKNLANTLKLVAAKGSSVFYTGEIAQKMLDAGFTVAEIRHMSATLPASLVE